MYCAFPFLTLWAIAHCIAKISIALCNSFQDGIEPELFDTVQKAIVHDKKSVVMMFSNKQPTFAEVRFFVVTYSFILRQFAKESDQETPTTVSSKVRSLPARGWLPSIVTPSSWTSTTRTGSAPSGVLSWRVCPT